MALLNDCYATQDIVYMVTEHEITTDHSRLNNGTYMEASSSMRYSHTDDSTITSSGSGGKDLL